MDKLQFKIDYLNGIVPITSVDSFFESLKNIKDDFDLKNFVLSPFAPRGVRNYNTRYHFMGQNNFIICYNSTFDAPFTALSPDEHKYNPYIYISISSRGLSYFSFDEFDRFTKYLYRVGFKCSRMDIACDIFNRDNEIIPCILKSFQFNSRRVKPEGVPFVVSKMSLEPKFNKSTGQCLRQVVYTQNVDNEGNISTNLTVGRHGNDAGMLRVYDKWLERGNDLSKIDYNDNFTKFVHKLYPDDYWYRIEIECVKKHSQCLFDLWNEKNLEIYDLFASALTSRFDIRISRSLGYLPCFCDVSPIWKNFINELSNNIHFVELPKNETVSVCEIPLDELKNKLLHYVPMLCAYEDLCVLYPDFKSVITVVNRCRYENKIQYAFLQKCVEDYLYKKKMHIVV